MKPILKILLILTLIFIIACSGTPVKKNPIYGTWKIISGKHNGNAAPQYMMNRTHYFMGDNTFKSVTSATGGNENLANWGNFYLINDSTMVTYHKDQFGNLDNVANTYNFHVRNDTLHFYGFYLRQIQGNPPMLAKVFIDEWWVRAGKQ